MKFLASQTSTSELGGQPWARQLSSRTGLWLLPIVTALLAIGALIGVGIWQIPSIFALLAIFLIVLSRGFTDAMVVLGVVSVTFSGLQIGPITFPDIFLILAGVGLIVAALAKSELRLPFWMFASSAIVLAGGLIPTLFLKSTGRGLAVLLQFVSVMLLVPVVIAIAGRTDRSRIRIVRCFVASAVVNAILALLQSVQILDLASRLTGWQGLQLGGRVRGLAAHPNQLGLICAIALPLTYFLYTRNRRWALAIAALGAGVLVSGSRAGLLAATASVFFYWLMAGRLSFATSVRVLAVILFGLVIGNALGVDDAFQRLTTADQSVSEANEARAANLREGVSDVLGNPLTGVGFEGTAHNLYLRVAQGGGLIALGGFVWFVCATMATGRRCRSDPIVVAVAASMATWMFAGIFQPGLYERFLYVPAGLLIGAGMDRRERMKRLEATDPGLPTVLPGPTSR